MGTTKPSPNTQPPPNPEDVLLDFVALVESASASGKQGPSTNDAEGDWVTIYSSSSGSGASTSSESPRYIVKQGRGRQASLFAAEARFTGVSKRAVFELMARPGNRILWDTSCEVGESIERVDMASSTALACESFVEYYRLAGAWPVVKQRDMVLLSVNATLICSSASPSSRRTRTYSASKSIPHASRPSKKGYQRFHLSVGGFAVEDDEDGAGIVFTQICDVGDLVKWTPAYVVKTCTSILLARSFVKIQEQARLLDAQLEKDQLIDSPLFSCETTMSILVVSEAAAMDVLETGIHAGDDPERQKGHSQLSSQISVSDIKTDIGSEATTTLNPEPPANTSIDSKDVSADTSEAADPVNSSQILDTEPGSADLVSVVDEPTSPLIPSPQNDESEGSAETAELKTLNSRGSVTPESPSSITHPSASAREPSPSIASEKSSLLSLAQGVLDSSEASPSVDTSFSSTNRDSETEASEEDQSRESDCTTSDGMDAWRILRQRRSNEAKRLSYFGDVDGVDEDSSPLLRSYPLLFSRKEQDALEEGGLEELLPRVLARENGLAAAHRLSKALSVLELRDAESATTHVRLEDQTSPASSRRSSFEYSRSTAIAETADPIPMAGKEEELRRSQSTDSLQAIMDEIADAAQPFFTPNQIPNHKQSAVLLRQEDRRMTKGTERRTGSWMASLSWWLGYSEKA